MKLNNSIVEKVLFELINICNLKCPACYMGIRLDEKKQEFSIENFVKVLDLTNPQQVDLLGGEPLLWKPLKEGIEECYKRGIKINLFSNLVHMTEELAEWLLEKNVNVTGKLNVGNPNDPEQRKIQAQMIGKNEKIVQKLLNGIEIMLKIGYRKPIFSLENLLRPQNIGFALEFVDWCNERNINPDLELPACADNLKNGYWNRVPSKEQIKLLIKELKKTCNIKLFPPHITRPCTYYFSALYFRPNGDIQPCSGNQTVLANVIHDENPIQKSLENEIIKIRRNLTQDKINEGKCKKCIDWNLCKGGCRATVENLGNPFGSYELCWK